MNRWKRSSSISAGLMVCLLSLIASPIFASPAPQAAPTPPLIVQPVAEQPAELSEAQMAEIKGELSILGELAVGAALGAIGGAIVGAYIVGWGVGYNSCSAK